MPGYLRARGRVQCSVAAVTLAVALTCGVHPVHSQQPAVQAQFRTEANFVRVDVYATRNGVPVTDLRREDFELFEDKSAQQIDQFTHIVTGGGGGGGGAQETRSEPSTVRDSAQAVETSSAGVMVLFLDAPQVDRAASIKIRAPLQRALARLVGPGDLIAVMTADMNARDIMFSRSAREDSRRDDPCPPGIFGTLDCGADARLAWRLSSCRAGADRCGQRGAGCRRRSRCGVPRVVRAASRNRWLGGTRGVGRLGRGRSRDRYWRRRLECRR